MRAFKKGAEIRLTKDDLQAALQHVLNDRILGAMMCHHYVTNLTVNSTSKYAVTMTISPALKNEESN